MEPTMAEITALTELQQMNRKRAVRTVLTK